MQRHSRRRCRTTVALLPGRRQPRSAFTMIDLTLTILILGILAAAAAPRLSGAILYYQVDAAARRIEADINYVQSYARFTNATCSVTFTASPAGYTTVGVPHLNNSGQAYAVNFAELGYPVTLAVNLNSGSTLSYTPSGVAQAGSPLTGLTTGTITITGGNQTRTVSIDPVTGKARRS